MAGGVPRIFVSIAAYRDPECQWTIKDLFEKAALPDRIAVGLCWQFVPGEDDDCFLFRTRTDQCRVLEFHAAESRGACWARHQVQKLWQGEAYYLQIDSHMRFAPDWDETLLAMLAACPSPRPVLSTYPLGYTPPDAVQEGGFTVMYPRRFDADGVLALHARVFPAAERPPLPVPSPLCSAGLFMAPSSVLAEVPYDPYLYFMGEEVTLAARLWTKGWDLFAPNGNPVYHDYGKTRRRHWQDNQASKATSRLSVRRIRHLLGIETSTDPEVLTEIERYGLGSVRSLQSWQEAAGVDLATATIRAEPPKPPWPKSTAAIADSWARLPAGPAEVPALLKRAGELAKAQVDEPALILFDKVLALQPDHIDAAFGKANAAHRLKRYQVAAEAYRIAANRPGSRAEALWGLGMALDPLDQFAEAEQALEEAASLRPEVRYYRSLTWLLFRKGDLAGAERAGRRAIARNPNDIEARFALAVVLLNAGKPEGWQHYEWRLQRNTTAGKPRYTELPRWRGEPLEGRPLMLWGEQGIGDEIMFAAYVAGVTAGRQPCALECDRRLAPLFTRSFPDLEVIARSNPPTPKVAPVLQCPTGSLPLLTGRGFEAQRHPYLRAEPERREALRRRLLEQTGCERLVAVSWRSGSVIDGNRRSTRLADWAALLTRPGVAFVSVQYGECAEELEQAQAAGLAIEPPPGVDPWHDLDGLAALLAACDLYLGIDNSTAHLAAALGLESWVLLMHRADWRWPQSGERTPIYPSMRLLRQPAPGDWAGVLAQAGAALDGWLARGPQAAEPAAA